jgi:DnaJ-class molecular chaperone
MTTELRPDASAIIRGIALDEQCPDCEGRGVHVTEQMHYIDWCRNCRSTGYVLTDEGRTLLTFIKRHGRFMEREV